MSKKIKIYFSEEDIQDMQHEIGKSQEPVLFNTWSPTTEDGEVIDVEIYTGQEPEEQYLVCSNNNCTTKIHLGEEFQHDKNYNSYCTSRECTDGIATWMTCLEKCWWDDN